VEPNEDGFFQAKSVVKSAQARRFPNPEVPTKHLARSERPFFKHRVDCSTKIASQGPSRLRIIKQVSSSFLKALAPFFHRGESECFTPIYRLKFGVDRLSLEAFRREEANHRLLFHWNFGYPDVRLKLQILLTPPVVQAAGEILL
jgi:hypothetical protein